MNERIRELVMESVNFRLDPDSNHYEAQVSPEDMELFAELIVRECMELGDKALQDGKWPADVLKEHFGVEL